MSAAQKKLRSMVFLSIGFLLPTFSAFPQAQAITYGVEETNAKVTHPWVASVWEDEDGDGLYFEICSGSLIAADVVLTAAHCVLDSNGDYAVQLKSDTLRLDGELVNVSAVWSSPRYDNRSIQNDIGLILLSEPVLDVAPVRLATKRQTRAVDALKNFTLYGWGEDQNGKSAEFLRSAKVQQQKRAALRAFTSSQFNPKTTIAAGRYLAAERVYSGACRGDSGGPLVARLKGVETVVGITSYGARSCRARVPSVFTKVSYYEGDIQRGIATLRARAALTN
jgi:secreted trypsin-like serine protease